MNRVTKKRLNICHQSTVLFVILVLASCSPHVSGGPIVVTANSTEPASVTASVSSTRIDFLTKKPTALPSENAHGAPLAAGPSPTFDNLPPETIVKFQSFEITSSATLKEKPTDALVLCSDFTIQLLHFAPEVKVETILETNHPVYCDATSPDGKWIDYIQDSDESPTGQWLIVQSKDGQQKKIPTKEWNGYVWLDNQHLIFNDFSNLPDMQRDPIYPAYPMVVLNPFTGQQTKLASNYSELHLDICGPGGSVDFGVSDVVYDPSLNRVIFPSWSGEHNYIVLWDRQYKTTLAKVETQSQCFGYFPLWSPDATQFALPINMRTMEWYGVSRKGEVEQLTHFGDYFARAEIGPAYNWSPDSKELAFWMDLEPSPCPGLRLGILQVVTKQVTNTCLPGGRYGSTLLWSLDGRYIVIQDDNSSPVKTILVDTENGQAFDITSLIEDTYPTGWLH